MTLLPLSMPHLPAIELHRWTLAAFGELRLLRAGLRAALAPGGTADSVERIAVVATELATNALRHGLPPAVVRLLSDSGRIVLDVADQQPGALPRYDTDRPLGAGGLGLQLARSFAVDVGCYRTGTTKHVWASFLG
jgi:serine/threonine-protein kinase RsbW